MRQVPGFDYRSGQSQTMTLRQWREQLDAIVAAGGHIKREGGETWALSLAGTMVIEVYARVALPRRRNVSHETAPPA